ncbi:histone deacetylase family protein [Ceratobasidium sp. AG-Ba]|nr:histone deacetylase family protein [Ceratobasidium sp. AG-Ba]QRW06922.1 histone deacetylase family protein [Ceratobasidium sp. AG-Ba]
MSDRGKLSIHVQSACAEHRYIRDKDLSTIVERPERLRALAIGVAAAIALTEASQPPASTDTTAHPDDLIKHMEMISLNGDPETSSTSSSVVDIVRHSAPPDASFMNNPAVRMIHALEEDTAAGSGEDYLSQLSRWVSDVETRLKAGESEIPDGEGLSQGDLYLGPRTLFAISGALQTTCDAVDSVVSSPNPRAFVIIRPPGHHCGSDEPAGFCWVNNVMVGAAYGELPDGRMNVGSRRQGKSAAHHTHGINRAVIFDIDLHHGNGTQSIAWKINAETHRKSLEANARRKAGVPESEEDRADDGLQICYGSLHDILSYPCEDGDPALTLAASACLSAHGQHIENVHLQQWKDEDDFFGRLYGDPNATTGEGYSTRLFARARQFLNETSADPSKTIIYVSCGFDAGEHEYESMSRHTRRVPTTFYNRFAHDAIAFANMHAKGRVVSVLEGGYSDRALIAGGMAWTAGMIGNPENRNWWKVDNLEKLESTIPSAKRKPRASAPTSTTNVDPEPWIARTLSLIPTLDATFGIIPTPAPRTRRKADPVPASARMTLRDRTKKAPEPAKPRSVPGSPSKSAKPKSSSKPVSSAAALAVPSVPRVPSPGEDSVSVEAGVDEAASTLQALAIGQSETGHVSSGDHGPLTIKIRRPKVPDE